MNDSREYRFPYLIRTGGDLPEGFPSFADDVFYPGLFLPRDDPDWFGRSANPPRVVLITPESLNVYFHAASRIPARALVLDERLSVETGRMLLIGWVEFASAETSIRLPYNRRVDAPVRNFLAMLRTRLLDPSPSGRDCIAIGDQLDLKFHNCLCTELESEELERIRLFIGPRRTRIRRWLFNRDRWTAGDVVSLTDRRMLWITERYRGAREVYGSFTAWAHPDNIEAIDIGTGASGYRLRIGLRNGRTWAIPIPDDRITAAEQFMDAAPETLLSRSRRQNVPQVRKSND